MFLFRPKHKREVGNIFGLHIFNTKTENKKERFSLKINQIQSIFSYGQKRGPKLNSPWSNSTDTLKGSLFCHYKWDSKYTLKFSHLYSLILRDYFTHNFYFTIKKFRLACESFQLFWAWFCWPKSIVLLDINDIDQCLLIPKQVTT